MWIHDTRSSKKMHSADALCRKFQIRHDNTTTERRSMATNWKDVRSGEKKEAGSMDGSSSEEKGTSMIRCLAQ